MNICTCGYCGEGGHSLSKCPELRTPLKEGFTSERGGDDLDGDDESLAVSNLMNILLHYMKHNNHSHNVQIYHNENICQMNCYRNF
jgi:hypothetical protein